MSAPPPPVGGLRVSGVSRRFRIILERNPTLKETLLRRRRTRYTELWALRDIDIEIPPGQAIGIVGANGSGKSTLLKVMAGIIPPDEGTVETAGTVASMIELGAGFHPDFTGRENAYMNAAIYGLSEKRVDAVIDQIIAFAEIEHFIDMPVRTYSSGMQMRLAFSVASHINPDILLLDEVLAVGDEAFQRKCFGRIFDYKRRGGTLVFVSHDAAAVERICDRAVLIEDGRVVADGPASEAVALYHQRLAAETTKEGTAADGPPRDADSWGHGPLRISNLHLEVDGAPTRRVLSGQRTALVFDVASDRRVERPVFGMAVKTPDGVLCFATNTSIEGVEIPEIDRPARVRVEIPTLNLHDGRFVLHASAVSSDLSEVHHWLENQWEFSVFPDTGAVGMVRADFVWTIEAVPGVPLERLPAA